MTATTSLSHLFRTWLVLGFQSFGGGSVTRYLMYQASVERYAWVTDDEFARYWAICQITPGINLLALTTLIGWKVAGAIGVFISLFGLLLPSVAITILVTAAYASIQNNPYVAAAIQGVIPATIGLSLIMAWRLAQPLLAESRREGRLSLLFSLGIIFVAVLATWYTQIPVMVVLLLGGVAGGLFTWRRRKEEEGRSM
jgi:chromate transporter